MKTLRKLSILLILAALTSCYSERTLVNARNNDHISLQTFYNELAPYGDWVEDYDYGYMWVPRVHRNFHPYATDGYWTMTDYGNTWVSNYSWGWAPFHYGRWLYDDYLGWAWVPGYEWAPAWVTWRSGGGYYGWAPMGPRMRINVFMDIPYSYWVFLPQNRMYGPSMHRYYSNRRRNVNIYHQTNIINNTYVYNNNTYYSGPSRREIERETGRRVSERRLVNSGRAGRATVDNRSVSIYRPEVSRTSSGRSERPSAVANRSSVNRSTSGSRSERVTDTPTRRSNVESNRNTATTPSTRRSSTVNRSTESQPTRNSNREAVNRSTQQQPSRSNREAVNRSTQKEPARSTNNRGTVNRGQNSSSSSSSTQRSSGNVNRQRATSQSSRSTAPARSAARSTTPARSAQSAASSSRSTSSRSSNVSSAPARSATTRSSSASRSTNSENASSSRSSSTRTGRSR